MTKIKNELKQKIADAQGKLKIVEDKLALLLPTVDKLQKRKRYLESRLSKLKTEIGTKK